MSLHSKLIVILAAGSTLLVAQNGGIEVARTGAIDVVNEDSLKALALQIDAEIVKIDATKKEMVLKINGAETTVSTEGLKLLDKDGKPAKLESFQVGQKVDATVGDDGVVTVIQARA